MDSNMWNDSPIDGDEPKPSLRERWFGWFRPVPFFTGVALWLVIFFGIKTVNQNMNAIPVDDRQVLVAWDDQPLIWTTKTPASRNQTTSSYELGTLPNDICMVDGVPLILSAGDSYMRSPSITYIRNNGDLVDRTYNGSTITESYWTGDICPSGDE